ncbi:ABC transporter ATP-binding protein [Bacilliculturomica massiliensis]|uniref:ABC transporter ATP-binding protein n=1 Tax=Bacilliculturomica massiliensis TaxID=1917867 RepID=UPI00102F6148|nr:oligopeptide/dipeptide ABC transporter ATP-binding protein [Bacilliculturomica massiliensis]
MEEILRVEKLEKHFIKETGFLKKEKKVFKAVNDVSFHINKGETLGLVGESGCGKSTTGRMIVDLIQPTSGSIFFEGKNIADRSRDRKSQLEIRKNIQMIFQDSYASLDPRLTAGQAVEEALDIHRIVTGKKEKREYIEKIFADVGLQKEQIDRYPHEFSGGQRQRIGIARAICLQPKIIICDEPVSALDVSIQAQIINNMEEIQKKYGISYLFISHDLSVVKHISDRVIVMYLGYIFEEASKEELFARPLHPYTRALVEATPSTNPDLPKRNKPALKNEIDTSLIGVCCPFANRCDSVSDICWKQEPSVTEAADGHKVRCHLYK